MRSECLPISRRQLVHVNARIQTILRNTNRYNQICISIIICKIKKIMIDEWNHTPPNNLAVHFHLSQVGSDRDITLFFPIQWYRGNKLHCMNSRHNNIILCCRQNNIYFLFNWTESHRIEIQKTKIYSKYTNIQVL